MAPSSPATGPRERLLRHGPEVLDEAELLALLLRTGRRGQPALALARSLLDDLGFEGLGNASVDELCGVGGIGEAKAAALLAAVELGRRCHERRLERGDPLRGPRDVARHFRARLRVAPTERFHVLMLDGRHRVLRTVLASHGTLTASLVHPREVFRAAIRESAAALILVHNHPSGDPDPSPEDVAVTRRLGRAGELVGIPVLDHVIVADRGFVSLREEGVFSPPRGEGLESSGGVERLEETAGGSGAPSTGPAVKPGALQVDGSPDQPEDPMVGPAPDVEATVERRRSDRAPFTVRVHYGTVDALFSEFTRDINEGGVYVSTHEPLPEEEPVVLQFRLPGSDAAIQARGRVVRVEPPTDGRPGGMAIEFDKLDASAQAEINRVIRELRKQAAP